MLWLFKISKISLLHAHHTRPRSRRISSVADEARSRHVKQSINHLLGDIEQCIELLTTNQRDIYAELDNISNELMITERRLSLPGNCITSGGDSNNNSNTSFSSFVTAKTSFDNGNDKEKDKTSNKDKMNNTNNNIEKDPDGYQIELDSWIVEAIIHD